VLVESEVWLVSESGPTLTIRVTLLYFTDASGGERVDPGGRKLSRFGKSLSSRESTTGCFHRNEELCPSETFNAEGKPATGTLALLWI
jgi:hypothetical protein